MGSCTRADELFTKSVQKYVFAQALNTPVEVVTHVAKRLAELLADFLKVEAVKVEAFDGPPLHGRKISQRTFEGLAFQPRFYLGFQITLFAQFQTIDIDRGQASPCQKRFSIKSPAQCDADDPCLQASFGRVEELDFPMEIEEHLLSYFLCLVRIAEHPGSQTDHQSRIVFE